MNAVSNACKSTLSTYIHIVPLMAFCDHLALLRRQVVSGVYTYVEVKSKLCLYAYFPNNFGLAPWLRHAGDGSVVTWGNARSCMLCSGMAVWLQVWTQKSDGLGDKKNERREEARQTMELTMERLGRDINDVKIEASRIKIEAVSSEYEGIKCCQLR